MATAKLPAIVAGTLSILMLTGCSIGIGPSPSQSFVTLSSTTASEPPQQPTAPLTPAPGTGQSTGTNSTTPTAGQPKGPNMDQYGGSTLLSCMGTGWFHPQKIGSRWWFCDPDGNVFWAATMGGVGGSQPQTNDTGTSYDAVVLKKYGDSNVTWAPQQNRRLESWGFNAIGEDSVGSVSPIQICIGCAGWPGGQQPVKMPIIMELLASNYAAADVHNFALTPMKDLMFGINSNYTAWRASLGDFFGPSFGQWLSADLQHDNVLVPYLTSPWTLGVLIDDGDWLWGFGGGPDFDTYPSGHTAADIAYMVLITSPVQTFNPSPVGGQPLLYTDSKIYSKTAAASPPAVCSISTPCTLRDYLYKKYNGSIGSLNAAWGSNYTTFDSTGQTVSGEQIAVGDGKTTIFTHTLAKTPASPESVLISEGGTAIAGDCPWFASACADAAPNTGVLEGGSGSPVPAGDQPWLGLITAQSCGCALPAQQINFKITYHMNPGYYTRPSREVGVTTLDGQLAVVPSPPVDANATGYDVYAAAQNVGTPGGWENLVGKQTLVASNVPFGTNWVEPNTGIVTGGSTLPGPSNSISYQSGVISLAFSTPPPPGTVITVSYTANGWMYGSGLMDEDGRHTQWLGTNPYCLQAAVTCDGKDNPLPNANANVATDLDGWIAQFSAEYFSTVHSQMKKFAPDVPYLGLDTLGGWATPARKEVLEGAAPYVDAVFTQWYPFAPNSQQELDYMEKYLGDRPLLNFLTLAANPDSCLWRYANPAGQFATQALRGQAYASIISGMLTSMRVTSDGTYPWIGSVWWSMEDSWSEKADWGLVSLEDNPYDGVCDQTTTTEDQWGYPCGGEEKNYGNVITPVEQANKTWQSLLSNGGIAPP